MLLLLVRHGPAGDHAAWAAAGKDDALRPLTPEGRSKTRRAAKGLARLLDGLDLLASSPLTRARETADLLASRFPKAERRERPELAPSAAPRQAARWLGQLRRSTVAVVGHEPHLSRLAALLLTGRAEPLFELKKGGAAVVDFGGPCRTGKGRLDALLTPRILRSIGGR